MFDTAVAPPTGAGCDDYPPDDHPPDDHPPDDYPPDDGLDDAIARMLADAGGDWSPDWSGEPPDEPPPTYGTCEPSGWLALELDNDTADPAALSDESLIEAIIGFDRLASWAAARQARCLAELAHRRPADTAPHTARSACVGSEFAPDEVGVALTLSRSTAGARIATACRLLSVLPATFILWESGRIDTLKARAIDDATCLLRDEQARAVEARVLPRAPQQTLAQLKAALARAVLAVDPADADSRHRQARRDRRVVLQSEADGMASLWALLTATDAAGAYTWLTRLAKGLGPDDPRTLDARRADLLAALLTGRLVTNRDTCPDNGGGGPAATQPAAPGCPAGSEVATQGRPIQPVAPGKPLIQIVIPHSTLTGADYQPAELVGLGPIPAALAREAAAEAVWRRLVTDPLSGTALDYGRTTYHPPAALADLVRVRDVHCRFPTCRRKAADAELDHTLAWADGGETTASNLHALCLHHHLLKHHAGWQVQAHPDGRLTWTTPTGHRHTTAPHNHGPEPPAPPLDLPRAAPPGPDLGAPPF
jgi:hypothetical protein